MSPTTTTAAGSTTPSRAMAPRIMSGAGRPRPTSAGDKARSTSPCQPRAPRSASLVDGANPVVRHTDNAAPTQRPQDVERAGNLGCPARCDLGLVGLRERGRGRGGVGGLEQPGEDVGLRPAHGLAHHDLASARRSLPGFDADGGERGSERGFHRAVVAHGRPRHVEARQQRTARSRRHPGRGEGVRGDRRGAGHASATGAGDEDDPGLDLFAQADGAVDALGVDPFPAPAHGWERGAEYRLGAGQELGGRVLAQREVERLPVLVGVADGQPAVGTLHHEELQMVLGRDRAAAAPSSASGADS